MVVRPDSPIEYPETIDEEWFKEYEWMNDEETFEAAYLEDLYLEEVRIANCFLINKLAMRCFLVPIVFPYR